MFSLEKSIGWSKRSRQKLDVSSGAQSVTGGRSSPREADGPPANSKFGQKLEWFGRAKKLYCGRSACLFQFS